MTINTVKKPTLAISVFAGLIIMLVLIGLVKFFQIRHASSMNFAPPPAAVNVAGVASQVWERKLNAIGTVRADEGITIMAETAGRIEALHFRSGDTVKRGTLLLSQNSDNEQAQLDSAQAQLALMTANFQRAQRLRAQGNVSQSQFDTAEQQLAISKAEVENLKSTLRKKAIRAPFSGKLGIRNVDLGQELLVGAAIVSLQSLDTLKVNFNLPQRWFSAINKDLPVEVSMLDSNEVMAVGEVNAIGVEVDQQTRNIGAQATLANNQGALIPGMAVEISIVLPEPDANLVIPATAVVYAAYGDSVYVIEKSPETDQLTARQQFIQIKERRGDFVAVASGLSEGEQVATSGAFKLFNGQAVAIVDSGEPEYLLNPTPSDS